MAELDVQIDARGARRGAGVVVRSLNNIRDAARKTDQQFGRTNKSFDRARRNSLGLGRAFKFLAAGLVARQVIRYADAWTLLSNRIKLVTDSSEEVARVQEEVFDISQRARISLEATGELYQRLARSAASLGLSQQRVLNVTESLSKAITISGVSADSANAAIVQLGQGLASGELRGQELRSVLEQTPRVARALADGLQVPIGALITLGEQGKLSAEAVITALESQRETIEAEFAELGPTIGQSFTILNNALKRSIGLFSESTGAAGGFAGIIIKLADFISGPFLSGLLQFGDILAVTIENYGDLANVVGGAFDQVGLDVGAFLRIVGDAVLKLPLRISQGIKLVLIEFGGFLTRFKTEVDQFANSIVGTIAVITGNDALVEEAIAGRIELRQREISEETAIWEAREELQREAIAQEEQLRKAIEDRAAARLAAAQVDLNKPGAGDPFGTFDRNADKNARALARELDSLAKRVIEDVSPAIELYTTQVGKLKQLLDTGRITQEQYTAAVRQAADAYLEAEGIETYNSKLERGKDLFEELRTPVEVYRDTVLDLADLLAVGAINQETFNRAVRQAQDDMAEASDAGKEMSDFMKSISDEAARSIFRSFSDFLFNPFEDGLEGLARSFANTLHKMASDALAAQVFKILQDQFASLAQSAGSGGFGGFLSGIASFFGGGFAEGGNFTGGRPILVGEEGPEIITPRASGTVIPNDMMGAAAAPNVEVGGPTIINTIEDSDIVAAFNRGGGDRVILNKMSENSSAYRQALGLN